MTDADKSTYKQLVYPALGACQEVHKHLGPFLNEYMYQDALAIELSLRGIPFDKEFLFTADYKGHTIEHRHFADFRIIVQQGPQRKPNEVFAMGRAGTSEYSLPKRNFGTCIENSSREDTPILIECKAVDNLADAHRQQLWNYMRLTGIQYGVLYNFAPVYAQCEKYHYDPKTFKMVAF